MVRAAFRAAADAAGDTVRTLYTSGRNAPLRMISWDLRKNRTPLGPAAVRDSIRSAQRRAFVTDSVRTAMRDTAQGGGPAALRAMQGAPGEPGVFTPSLGRNWGLVPGGGGGGGGFGGGAGALVEPGIYLVTVRFNGREYKQTVRVERPNQTSMLSGGWQAQVLAGQDDDDPEEP